MMLPVTDGLCDLTVSEKTYWVTYFSVAALETAWAGIRLEGVKVQVIHTTNSQKTDELLHCQHLVSLYALRGDWKTNERVE